MKTFISKPFRILGNIPSEDISGTVITKDINGNVISNGVAATFYGNGQLKFDESNYGAVTAIFHAILAGYDFDENDTEVNDWITTTDTTSPSTSTTATGTMKIYKKGILQTITLDQTNIGSGKTVKVTLVGDDGNYIQDSNENDIKDLAMSYDSGDGKYKVDVTILGTTDDQFIRLYFYSTDATIDDTYYPEDAKLNSAINLITPTAEVVPVQYFIDYILTQKVNDPKLQTAITAYTANKEGLRSQLKAAESDLEIKLQMFITERTVEDIRDNFFELFRQNLWDFQTAYVPINELTSMEFWYGKTQIMGVDKSLFTYDRMMGLIDFLPLPGGDTAGLYSLLVQNISAMGLAIITGGALDRIPNMFRATYKTGLWCSQTDSLEKEAIRVAVARRAYIKVISYLDPKMREGSISESIDGASKSKSYNMDKVIDRLEKQEDQWVLQMQRRYAKGADMVIC